MEAKDLPTGIPLPQDAPRIALPRGHSRATTNTVDIAAPDLVYVPAATFTMGNPYSNLNEGPSAFSRKNTRDLRTIDHGGASSERSLTPEWLAP